MSKTNHQKSLSDLMFWNHPYGEDNFSIVIKCRKCYKDWLNCYNITKFNNSSVLYNNMNQITEGKFVYKITRELYNEAITETDCGLCLQDDCHELDQILDRIEKHRQKNHRCSVK